MPNYEQTLPRRHSLDHNNVSPCDLAPSHPTGILNGTQRDQREWRDADSRPIDFLYNHYDELGDRPVAMLGRSRPRPVVPQDGNVKSRESHEASHPSEPNEASETNESQPNSGANAGQGTVSANGSNTRGADPSPSPPRKPTTGFSGGFRAKQQSSSSTSSSSSSSSSSEASQGEQPPQGGQPSQGEPDPFDDSTYFNPGQDDARHFLDTQPARTAAREALALLDLINEGAESGGQIDLQENGPSDAGDEGNTQKTPSHQQERHSKEQTGNRSSPS